ncbi:hypothetical protein B9Z51_04125 [Limnohabitans sp. T6-5]|uniref:sensor histidine kinase n=1 Tax=Limnohabitans sp. T6-5 TaxID=1100724 RepID=UPI000D377E18|nr:HAMP domain-containing sensor histidine kinase [Limnohabitans sp. T6-5]PUE11485.1 hypothetical protein B9Z51_04125 [Limnohabitans sp. T6-5]
MIPDVQTIFWMDAFLYLMLHAAIWYGLARFRSQLVSLWSLSGIFSALSLCVFGSRGWLSDDTVVVLGVLLMALGNWGRQIALRSLADAAPTSWLWVHGLLNLAFLAGSYTLQFSGASVEVVMLVFYGYFTFNCFEYFVSGQRIGVEHDTIGATSVKAAGGVLTVSLGIKTFALLMGWGATELYDVSWDQFIVFAGQFVAISMLNVGFMQIFIDQTHRARLQAEQQLAREQERASLFQQHSDDLGALLREREEIIRQLTLSNKSAGMGALVASFAHELNQPLTATMLHAELVQSKLSTAMVEQTQPDLKTLKTVADAIVKNTQRSGDIIRKLRNLFRMGKGEYTRMDFERLVMDVIDLVSFKMLESEIRLSTEFDENFRLTGDATQLQQVVLNLLNNAIDAMLESPVRYPHLKVHGQVLQDHLELHVQDNGMGIDPERADDVFSLFKTTKSQGMGVGLWLSKSIIESHGGKLTFKSEPGKGTVFTLSLPTIDYALL